jgi:hypothetical protein
VGCFLQANFISSMTIFVSGAIRLDGQHLQQIYRYLATQNKNYLSKTPKNNNVAVAPQQYAVKAHRLH